MNGIWFDVSKLPCQFSQYEKSTSETEGNQFARFHNIRSKALFKYYHSKKC